MFIEHCSGRVCTRPASNSLSITLVAATPSLWEEVWPWVGGVIVVIFRFRTYILFQSTVVIMIVQIVCVCVHNM